MGMSNFNKGDLEAAIAKAKQHKTTGGPDAPGHIFAVGLIIGMSAGQFAKMDDLYNACKWDCETVDELLTFINKQPKDGGMGVAALQPLLPRAWAGLQNYHLHPNQKTMAV